MRSDQIAGAYELFLANDVPLDVYLSLEVSRIDNSRFLELQRNMPNGPESIDALVEFSEDMPSAVLRDQVFATSYSNAGLYDKALSFAVKALEVLPRWDLWLCGTVFNTLAWNLFLLGRLQEARRWGEIGLTFNPFYFFLIGTLSEVYAGLGEAEKAESCYQYLKRSGYSSTPWGSYQSNTSYQNAPPYVPSVDNMTRLTDTDLFKILVSQVHFSNRPEETKRINLALSLLAAGRIGSALAVSQQINAEGDLEVQAGQIKQAAQSLLSQEQAKRITSRRGIYSSEAEKRVKATKKLTQDRNRDGLWHLVFDPDFDVSMYACEGLLTLGIRAELSFYLELANEWEYKTGKSIYHRGAPKPYDLAPVSKTEVVKLRGVPLVEKIIEDIKAEQSEIEIAIPQPMPTDLINELTLPGGLPLPPSLRRFLDFDSYWFLSLYGDPNDPQFNVMTVAQAVKENLNSQYFWQEFVHLPTPLPQALCIPLEVGSETMRVLFLAKADEYGEYPILDLDIDDTPSIYLDCCGLDVWLAHSAGLTRDAEIDFPDDMKACRRRLFGGRDYLLCDFTSTEGVEVEAAPSNPPAEKKPKRTKQPSVSSETLAALPMKKLSAAFGQSLGKHDTVLAARVIDELAARFGDTQSWKDYALNAAIWEDEPAIVRRLLALGANPNTQNSTYGPMLVLASSWRDFDIIKALVEAGAELNVPDKDGETALGNACEKHRAQVVRYLLEHGANPASADVPIRQACDFFYQETADDTGQVIAICEMLLAAGADVNQQRGQGIESAILEAVRHNRPRLIEYLLAKGANPNQLDWHGDNALQAAWRDNHAAAFDVLLKTDARRNVRNADGWSLADIFDETCQLPKVLNVRLYESDQPQQVRFRLKAMFKNKYLGSRKAIIDAVASLAKITVFGLAGSDHYVPDAGQATWQGDSLVDSDPNNFDAKPAVYEVVGSYTLEAVAASAMSHWICGFFEPAFVTMEMEILADPVEGQTPAIDTEQAILLIRSHQPAHIHIWPALPFPLTEAGAPGRLCTVTFATSAEFVRLGTRLHALTQVIVSMVSRFNPSPIPYQVWMGFRKVDNHAVLEYKSFVSADGQEYLWDAESTRALVLNALHRWQNTYHNIERVEWSLGITAMPSHITDEQLSRAQVAEADRIEIAPSGRSTCRSCRQKIRTGEMRFALNTETYSTQYYHLACAEHNHPERLRDAMERFKARGSERAASSEDDIPF
jgi:ankyrin repeat protein/tetratricopeptide (TPR) repeat protein